MRSTSRLFLAALALVSAAALVRAQDGTAPKPAPPDSASASAPTSKLPAIPFADGRATAPAAEKPGTITTEELPTDQTVPAPANRSFVEAIGSFPSANPATNGAPVKVVQAQTLSVNLAAIQTASEVNEASDKRSTRGWILIGIAVALLLGSVTRYRSRLPKRFRSTPVADVDLEPAPAPVRAN